MNLTRRANQRHNVIIPNSLDDGVRTMDATMFHVVDHCG
jgi:hypothetical protein